MDIDLENLEEGRDYAYIKKDGEEILALSLIELKFDPKGGAIAVAIPPRIMKALSVKDEILLKTATELVSYILLEHI